MEITSDNKQQVRAVKLVSGEELLAKITDIENDSHRIEISKPLMLAPGHNGALTLIPATFLGNIEKPIMLNTLAIVMISEPVEQLTTKYLELTSGISLATSLPGKKIIMEGV